MNVWNRFWHDFEIERSRMAVARFGFFALLAWDLWSTFLGHAGRYGAGGFNVTQAAWLDAIAPLPTPAIVGIGWLFGGYLALRIAFGIAVQSSIRLLSVIYIAIYVWNQADSYQHHYFICLLLAVFAFIPADGLRTARADEAPDAKDPAPEAEGDAPATEQPIQGRVFKHWSIRMLYMQISFLYFWTAITKSDPTWLGGSTLDNLVSKPNVRPQVLALGEIFGLTEANIFPWMAVGVMAGQWFAAVAFQVRKLWIVALFVVPSFHIFVEFIEFDIEYFSYYMIMVDVVLLLPPRVWRWLEQGAARASGAFGGLWARLWRPQPLGSGPRIALALVSAAIAGGLTLRVAIEGQPVGGVLVAMAALLAALGLGSPKPVRPVHVALGQVLAAALMVASVQSTDAVFDYYRQWAGDLKRRGDLEGAALRYEQANAATDGPARFYQLGKVYARLGREDEALKAYEASRVRQEAALADERRATHKDATDGEAWSDVGDRLLRVRDRCLQLASSYGAAGRSEDAAEASRCANQSARDALEAFQSAVKFAPKRPRGHRGLAEARRALGQR